MFHQKYKENKTTNAFLSFSFHFILSIVFIIVNWLFPTQSPIRIISTRPLFNANTLQKSTYTYFADMIAKYDNKKETHTMKTATEFCFYQIHSNTNKKIHLNSFIKFYFLLFYFALLTKCSTMCLTFYWNRCYSLIRSVCRRAMSESVWMAFSIIRTVWLYLIYRTLYTVSRELHLLSIGNEMNANKVPKNTYKLQHRIHNYLYMCAPQRHIETKTFSHNSSAISKRCIAGCAKWVDWRIF